MQGPLPVCGSNKQPLHELQHAARGHISGKTGSKVFVEEISTFTSSLKIAEGTLSENYGQILHDHVMSFHVGHQWYLHISCDSVVDTMLF